MHLEKHISDLLYCHSCVIVPEFGGFLANKTHGSLDREHNSLLPPTKSVSFNQNLSKNDGLLVAYLAELKNLDFDECLNKVLEVSRTWKNSLREGNRLNLDKIGVFHLDEAEKLIFEPSEHVNYLTSSFGMVPISAHIIQREVLKKEIEELEEAVPLKFTPEQRKEPNTLRPWLKYAAVLALFVALGSTGYLGYKNNAPNDLLLEERANTEVQNQLQRATFFDAEPIELPPLELKVKKVDAGPKYHVIAGAFRSKANADRKVQQLKTEGFTATYVGQNSFGLHQVAFVTTNDQKEALGQLRLIRQNNAPDAWLLTAK